MAIESRGFYGAARAVGAQNESGALNRAQCWWWGGGAQLNVSVCEQEPINYESLVILPFLPQ